MNKCFVRKIDTTIGNDLPNVMKEYFKLNVSQTFGRKRIMSANHPYIVGESVFSESDMESANGVQIKKYSVNDSMKLFLEVATRSGASYSIILIDSNSVVLFCTTTRYEDGYDLDLTQYSGASTLYVSHRTEEESKANVYELRDV